MNDNVKILNDLSGIIVTEKHTEMCNNVIMKERKLMSQPLHKNVENVGNKSLTLLLV